MRLVRWRGQSGPRGGFCSSSSSDSHDTDSDRVDDAVDNCPSVYNPDQVASFGSHTVLGDACDDEDADGIVDATDNCPLTANVDQLDTDGNGVGDVCDRCEVRALAADIWTGPGSGASLPAPMAAMGGKLYFSASDGMTGHNLWVYDPTQVGSAPSLIEGIFPGSTSSSSTSVFVSGLNALNDKLCLKLVLDGTLRTIMVYDPTNPSDGIAPALDASENSEID